MKFRIFLQLCGELKYIDIIDANLILTPQLFPKNFQTPIKRDQYYCLFEKCFTICSDRAIVVHFQSYFHFVIF